MTHSSTPLSHCRICGTSNITEVLDLGIHAITGVFPKTKTEFVPSGPLRLMLCKTCGLVQLGDSYDLADIYTDSYGYRSSLNKGMVDHLRRKATKLMRMRPVTSEDLVVDIGSNDGTFLSFFSDCTAIGIDPLGGKFEDEYRKFVLNLIPDFFPTEHPMLDRKAAIITSIAMFYDLPDPKSFVEGIKSLLAPDGIWHVEMSYLPTMLEQGSIDTVCHEHLEYYSLEVLHDLFRDCGMRIVDAETNSVNGGSIALTVAHTESDVHRDVNYVVARWLIQQEQHEGMKSRHPFAQFSYRAKKMRAELTDLISTIRRWGATVGAIGASTKGNVLLQYCGFTDQDIDFVMDVNPEKHGRFTPGTLIPIVSEEEGRARKPDYMLVPIWHFREGVIQREREYLANGGKLIFPLPRIEVVG